MYLPHSRERLSARCLSVDVHAGVEDLRKGRILSANECRTRARENSATSSNNRAQIGTSGAPTYRAIRALWALR